MTWDDLLWRWFPTLLGVGLVIFAESERGMTLSIQQRQSERLVELDHQLDGVRGSLEKVSEAWQAQAQACRPVSVPPPVSPKPGWKRRNR